MTKTPLNQLLSNQFLIFSFIKEKLEVVNFIRWGYDNNLPVLINNRFLHSVAHIYYRSVIVEICTLFDNHKHQSNNFYLLVKPDKKFIRELSPETIALIEQKLAEAEVYFTDELRDIRNEEVSHFRFKERTVISLNNKYLKELNILLKIAEDIIGTATDGQIDQTLVAAYATHRSGDALQSLQNLLQEINGLDYYELWKRAQSF
jgi:hypothetical protein